MNNVSEENDDEEQTLPNTMPTKVRTAIASEYSQIRPKNADTKEGPNERKIAT